MVKKSKLLLAFDAHKRRDYDAEKQKKLVKSAEKRKKEKKAKAASDTGSEEEKEGEQNKDGKKIDEDKVKPKHGGNEKQDKKDGKGTVNEKGGNNKKDEDAEDETGKEEEDEDEDEDEDENEEEEDDIPLSDLSENDQEDVIPHQRLTINNSAAINTSLKRISFITSQTPFSEHNSLVSKEPIDVPDPNDDLNRELAFYKACHAAAVTARGLLKKEGIPFSRPGDYFAEMVKSDEHMDKIKKSLYDEAAAKKASAEARRQRDLKKFGKQVQVAKLQQRQKDKRETLDKIDTLKKKRKADTSGPTEDTGDLFDVAVDDASKPSSGKRSRSGNETLGPSKKRQKKDQKFGFGGKKRNSKSGDAMSSSDLKGFSAKKMKAGANKSSRPGKSKRKAQA